MAQPNPVRDRIAFTRASVPGYSFVCNYSQMQKSHTRFRAWLRLHLYFTTFLG